MKRSFKAFMATVLAVSLALTAAVPVLAETSGTGPSISYPTTTLDGKATTVEPTIVDGTDYDKNVPIGYSVKDAGGTGISIDASTGKVTVPANAKAGTATITYTYKTKAVSAVPGNAIGTSDVPVGTSDMPVGASTLLPIGISSVSDEKGQLETGKINVIHRSNGDWETNADWTINGAAKTLVKDDIIITFTTQEPVENNAGVVIETTAGTPAVEAKLVTKTASLVLNAPVAVAGVTLNKTTATIVRGNTATLVATVSPPNAANKNVTWSSSDEAVATVDDKGVVTGVAVGTATITVTTVDGNKTATCAVTVVAPYVPDGGGSGTTTPSNPSTKPSDNVGANGEVRATDVAAEAAKAAAATGTPGGNSVVVKNATTITPATLKSMAEAAAKAGGKVELWADTTDSTGVLARLYLDPVAGATVKENINLSVKLDEKSTAPTRQTFAKHFDNNVQVASFGQKGSFGMDVKVALKVDLKELNTKTLRFYSYDKATNKCIPITNPGYWIDKNGYLRLNLNLAGDLIITDKPLTLKK